MSPVRMSSIEAKVRTILAFYEAFNRRDMVGMMKLLSDDCLFESAHGRDGQTFTGKEAIAQYWQAFIKENPSIRFEGEDVIDLRKRCIMRWQLEWEDAAGEKKHLRGVDIFQFREGLICKQYSYVKGFSTD